MDAKGFELLMSAKILGKGGGSPTPPEPPADGKTRLYITLAEGRLSPVLGLGVNGSVDVDWGDGTAHGTLTGTDISTLATIPHTYAQSGDYVITLTAAEGTEIAILGESSGSLLLTKDGTTANESRVYRISLKKAYIGDGVTSIGSNAFNGCFGLAIIIIPDSVTSIANNAFSNCFGLANITIPDSVTSIGNGAFNACFGLGFVKFESTTPPTIGGSTTFNGAPTDCIIYVPQGALEAYTSATNYPDDSVYTYVEY